MKKVAVVHGVWRDESMWRALQLPSNSWLLWRSCRDQLGSIGECFMRRLGQRKGGRKNASNTGINPGKSWASRARFTKYASQATAKNSDCEVAP